MSKKSVPDVLKVGSRCFEKSDPVVLKSWIQTIWKVGYICLEKSDPDDLKIRLHMFGKVGPSLKWSGSATLEKTGFTLWTPLRDTQTMMMSFLRIQLHNNIKCPHALRWKCVLNLQALQFLAVSFKIKKLVITFCRSELIITRNNLTINST